MDEDETTILDTTELRLALAPQLLPRLARILVHAQTMRTWATQATVLSDIEREALLEHLNALEQSVQGLAAGYLALKPPARDSAQAPTS